MTTNLLFLSASLLAATTLPANAQNGSQVIDHVLEYSGTDITGRIDFTYDPAGRVIEILTQVPTAEDSFENYKKENYGYDDQGRRNVVEKLLWDDTYKYWYANDVDDDAKTVTSFNDQGRPSEVYYYGTYDHNSDSWGEKNMFKYHGVFTHDGNKGTENRYKQTDGKQQDDPSNIVEYTYDDNNRVIEKIISINDFFMGTIPTDRFIYSYDGHNNITLEEKYMYNGGEDPWEDPWGDDWTKAGAKPLADNSDWAMTESHKFEYEYDADGNIIRKKEYRYNEFEAEYVLYSDLTYKYFHISTEALNLPYFNDFGKTDSFDGFSTKDANKDGNTWTMGNGFISCTSTEALPDPDIVYLPAMNFSNDYEVEITLKASVADASKPGKLQLILCNNDQEHTGLGFIGDIRNITSETPTEITGRIVVDKNSPFVIGICFDNDQVGSTIIIDDISVKNGRSAETPQSPYGLAATAAHDGSLQVKLTWYPPTQNIAGGYLESSDGYTVDNMILYRDDEEEPLYETGKQGTSLATTYTDTSIPQAGEYTYRVYAEVGGMRSDAAVVTLKVGYSVPQPITGFKVVENEDHSVTLSWDAPGAKDGDVKYWILRNNEEVEREFVGTSYTDRGIDISAGQAYCYYMVQPYNDMGPAPATYSELLFVGESTEVPFKESFAGKTPSHMWMDEIVAGKDHAWGYASATSSIQPQDEDGGMALFQSTLLNEGDVVRFTSEKIDLSTTTEPEMTFYMYHLTGEATGDAIVIEASKDNGEYVTVNNAIAVSGYEEEGWTQHIVPLADFAGEKNVRISLRGISAAIHDIAIDNIVVGEKGCAGVGKILAANTIVYSANGEIIISAAGECEIRIFSISGTPVYSATASAANIPVDKGIYIVTIDGAAVKVIVK